MIVTYKLLHKVFGWDYIYWENTADQGIARVHNDGVGQPYYWRYKITKSADVIKNPEQVRWLTCHPSKYYPEKE